MLRTFGIAIAAATLVTLLFAYGAHAQVVPGQNQVIVAPYGQGFVVSTSTSPTHKLGTSLIDLAGSFITGILGVVHGGTGSSTLSGILKGNGTSAVQSAVPNTDYQVPITLTTSGTSGAATFNGTTLNVPNYTTSGGGSGNVSTSTNETAGTLAYWTSNSATPALLGKVSTSTLTVSGPFVTSGTIGSLVGGSNSTITWTGLATTSQPSSSNILVSDGSAGVFGVSTSTATLGLGLSGSLITVGTGQSLSIATSSLFTGTTGQNAYFNGTNSIIGTSTLFTSTASHIGIGTTSPASELSIQSVVTSGAQSEDLLTLANTASGGLWNFRIGNGTGFAAGYFNICQGQCTGTNYELQFQGFGVVQARGYFSAPSFASSITGRGASPILAWTNTGGSFNGTLDVGENYVSGNINLNNWIGGTGSWNIKRSDGSSLALATLLNSNNNLGIGTSTPGTFISAGSSTNAINLDVYATSTLTHGLNITSGCFSVAGTCITGGSSYTATYPITLTGSAFGLAFGTTTSNTWAGTQTFTNAPVVSAFGAGSLYSTSAGLIQTAATSSASAASTAVWRDANQNAFAQNFVSAATTFPSLGTTATLTAASPRTWVITGTNTQTFKLPVGTTLTAGAQYNFNNNSTQPITIVDNGSNTLGVVPSGGSSFAQIYDVSTSNGSWDVHARLGHNIVSGDSTLGIGTTSPYAAIALGGGNLVLGAATAGGTPGDLYLPKLGTAAGSFLAVDASGKVIATTTPSAGYSPIGTTGQFPYFSATNTLTATSSVFLASSGYFGIGSSSPSALATIGYGYQPAQLTVASTSVWAAGSYQYTAPTGTVFIQISLSGGGGSGDTGSGGSGASIASTTLFMKAGDTGTIYVGQGGKFSGAQATGYKLGGLGASSVRNGGASSAFTASSTGQTLIACGGGASGDTAGGSAASSNVGGNGGAGGGGFAGGGGGCGTDGGNASGSTPGTGGTGGSYATGVAGNGGASGGNNGGDGKITLIAYQVPAGTTNGQLIAGALTVNPGYITLGTTTAAAFLTVSGGKSGVPGLAIFSDSAPSINIQQYISSVLYTTFFIDRNGHITGGGPAPTASSCTGFSAASGSNDNAGSITMTSGTSCTINFANTWQRAPVCVVTQNTSSTGIIRISTLSSTQLGITSSANITNWTYICQGI